MADDQRRWFVDNVMPLDSALRRRARKLVRGDAAEADDLVNDTFARLLDYRGWRSVTNPAALGLRILGNLAIDRFRRRTTASIDSGDLAERILPSDAPGPEAAVLWRDELRSLIAIVEELPAQQRRVLILCKVEGLSHREIAVRLGLSVSTVEKHLIKALRFCSERMDRAGVDEGSAMATRSDGAKS